MLRFALGAATGKFTSFKNACAVKEDGTRIASVSSPQETSALTLPAEGYTMVSGPGKNASRSFSA